MTIHRGSIALTLLVAAALALPPAAAQNVKERTIKLALANTADSAHGLGAQRFADIVAKAQRWQVECQAVPGRRPGR